MKFYFLFIILLLVPIVHTKEILTPLNITVNKNQVQIIAPNDNINFQTSNNSFYQFQRKIKININDTIINKELNILKIQKIIIDNKINETKLINSVNQKIDSSLFDQQKYFQNTFLPEINKFNELKNENINLKKENNILKSNINNFKNYSNERINEQKKIIKSNNNVFNVIIVLLISSVLFFMYIKFKKLKGLGQYE